jgi:hypothetical protein
MPTLLAVATAPVWQLAKLLSQLVEAGGVVPGSRSLLTQPTVFILETLHVQRVNRLDFKKRGHKLVEHEFAWRAAERDETRKSGCAGTLEDVELPFSDLLGCL